VKSNLTKKGLSAHIAGKGSGDTNKKGAVSLSGLCPGDLLTITAKGYSDGTATVDASHAFRVTLDADPATTLEQDVKWESQQNWKADCALLHPDNHAYVSMNQCIALGKQGLANGYQNVSVKVHSVTYITWTLPHCQYAHFGPKTYKHAAAINATVYQASPQGGVVPVTGITHWVQTKDHVWRFFLANGCSVPVGL